MMITLVWRDVIRMALGCEMEPTRKRNGLAAQARLDVRSINPVVLRWRARRREIRYLDDSGGQGLERASGNVRREGVTGSDPPLSRATSATDWPKATAEAEGLPLATDQHREASAFGRGLISGAKFLVASVAALADLAPKVVIKLSPLKPSWAGAAMRSKNCAGTYGFWMRSAKGGPCA